MLDKSFYTTVLSQTYSSCGRYLLAGNSYGEVAIYDLEKIFHPNVEYKNTAEHIFSFSANQICSMISTKEFLVLGTQNEIIGLPWNSIVSLKATKPAWSISLPNKHSEIDPVDVNSLWLDDEQKYLYAGCGDNNIYSFDLEERRLVRTYAGHTDYIHSVHGQNSDIISGGEDGDVLLWDVRSNNPTNKITPHKDSKLARPDLGKWIGAASLADDWLICGGGPRLSLWQTRTLQASTTFDLPDHGIHVSYFHEDRIIAAGVARHLYQVNYTGDTIVQIPVSATTVYSAVYQCTPYQAFSIAGSSSNIDLCNNMNYKDQTLVFK